MLHEFITENRAEIIQRCRSKIATRPAPRATDAELEFGVPLFLDQLVDSLRYALEPSPEIGRSAAQHGSELLERGFTIAQVVHDYGGICQAITELAVVKDAPMTTREFKLLNGCLDDATAEAVTEYGRLREHEGTERLGRLAHELRNVLNTATLSFAALREGRVGLDGSTAAVLSRSLTTLQALIDRELTEVRLRSGLSYREMLMVCDFIEDVEVAATMDAQTRGVLLSVPTVPRDIVVHADRQILSSVLANLLQNAFKFTRPGGVVTLTVRTAERRVLIDIADECGGLPPGKAEELFAPFAQRGADRTGLGLGLAICLRGVHASDGELRVVNHPGHGCVFTVDLPRPSTT
jgi:signal transduction histidine kinase